MERKLDIKNLRISFRTNNGTVKAVRDINLELDKGETLAIVGESGSGKSVTARAMMGILAPNSIIESGEIIYDGKDLLKISEDEFHTYRGNKLAMVFQDPMSSLNPIMKIGKQLTEAMLLNGKASQHSAKKAYGQKEKIMNAIKHNLKIQVNTKDIADIKKSLHVTHDNLKSEEYIRLVRGCIQHTCETSLEQKKLVIQKLEEKLVIFEKPELIKSECLEAEKELTKLVEASINRLAVQKDSLAYTFHTSIKNEISLYFNGIPKNKKEQKRFDLQSAKRKKGIAKGKDIATVIPAVLVDLDLVQSNIKRIIINLHDSYQKQLEQAPTINYNALTIELIQYMEEQLIRSSQKVTKEMAKKKAIQLMEEVGIPNAEKRFEQYPFQFSGGMRQRIVIAVALAANPDILICDEPTTALDVTIQAQILELINRLKKERQLSVIFITHDLGVVANMADKIAVMYAGKIVEYGTVDEIFYEPAHPYTWALLSSMPDLDTKEKLEAIPGTPPNMIYPPVGDAFATRNKYAMQIDFEQQPPLFEITPTHSAATWLLHPDAPKVEPPKIVTERIKRFKQMGVTNHGK